MLGLIEKFSVLWFLWTCASNTGI